MSRERQSTARVRVFCDFGYADVSEETREASPFTPIRPGRDPNSAGASACLDTRQGPRPAQWGSLWTQRGPSSVGTRVRTHLSQKCIKNADLVSGNDPGARALAPPRTSSARRCGPAVTAALQRGAKAPPVPSSTGQARCRGRDRCQACRRPSSLSIRGVSGQPPTRRQPRAACRASCRDASPTGAARPER